MRPDWRRSTSASTCAAPYQSCQNRARRPISLFLLNNARPATPPWSVDFAALLPTCRLQTRVLAVGLESARLLVCPTAVSASTSSTDFSP
eukprot:1304170-Rhodomonas_salina.2